jgi:hypothetical protein
MSLHKRGYDLADGAPVSANNIKDREYHHLFPVGMLGLERDSPHVNRAVNCALVTWRTNRKIAAKTPADYIKERSDGAILGENELNRRLASHMIPHAELVAGDYELFIDERARMMRKAMTLLCAGETISD